MNFQYDTEDFVPFDNNRYILTYDKTFYRHRFLSINHKVIWLSRNCPIKSGHWKKRNWFIFKNGMNYNLSVASQVASLYHLILYYCFYNYFL